MRDLLGSSISLDVLLGSELLGQGGFLWWRVVSVSRAHGHNIDGDALFTKLFGPREAQRAEGRLGARVECSIFGARTCHYTANVDNSSARRA